MEHDPWWEEEAQTARTVHEPEKDTWSGLYDAAGNELHREREPFGFVKE